MFAADIGFLLAMGATALAYLAGVQAAPRPRMIWGGLAIGVAAMWIQACLFAWWGGGSTMLAMRLLAWGLFGLAPLILIATAWIVRSSARQSAVACAGSALLLLAVALEAFWLAPERLVLRHLTLTSSKLSRPLRIVVVTDIQCDRVGDHERQAVSSAVAQQPDLLLFLGDYVQVAEETARRRVQAELRAALVDAGLQQRAPRLGAFAVRGNTEGYLQWQEIFTGLPVKTLTTSSRYSLAGEIELIALDLHDSFNTQLTIPRSANFQVICGHGPDFVLGNHGGDLCLAGHVHGGQVQLPFVGPLMTYSRIPRHWASGELTVLGHERWLVVSRGVGMERAWAPRLRFLSTPEVVVIDLAPAR
jgi:predicted MPP superfamily phosphohydrolase